MRGIFAGTLALLVSASFLVERAAGVVVANWTFETSTPADVTNSAAFTNVSANSGTGTFTGVHASASTDWSTPTGNGSANAVESNNWAIGDYYQFSFSMTGLHALTVEYDQTRDNQGSTLWDLTYSINGGAFVTALNDYTVSNTNWNTSTRQSASTKTVNLISTTALNNAASVVMRIVVENAPSNANGTAKVDNILIVASIPESSSFLLGGLVCGVASAGCLKRQRLKRNVGLSSSVTLPQV